MSGAPTVFDFWGVKVVLLTLTSWFNVFSVGVDFFWILNGWTRNYRL